MSDATSPHPLFISESWQRCSTIMQRDTWKAPHQALGVTFSSIFRRKSALLAVAQAALEDAWEYMEGRPCALLTLDESACLLSTCGHPETLQALDALGLHPGSYCPESSTGSCALSLAALLGQPVKTAGEQHFKRALAGWAFCATPIFDNHGRLAGSIALGCRVEDAAPGDVSLTLAIAREVGNSLLTDNLLTESNRHLNQLYGLLESMDDGVMAWNEHGVLQFINQRAANLLLLSTQESQGKTLTELLTLPVVLHRAIQAGSPLNHVEVTFESQRQFIDALVTLKPISEEQGHSFILLIHPVEQMRQLMTSQLGKVSYTFARMQGNDPDTRRLVHFGRQAARGKFPVLLYGEEGVGKEILSQAIHNESENAAGPYIAVNCQHFSDPAIGSDFLGLAPGDEQNGQLSKLELAHGGTLFLEKIEYLTAELQSSLLQVIKQGALTRLDARRMTPVDVKIIATTTTDLATLVEQNRFSRQLYYALHAFEIHIPPLRQRRRSIPALVRHQLARLEKRFGVPMHIDPDVLEQLGRYSWPGNDFELSSVIENIAMRCEDNHIHLSHLPDWLFNDLPNDDNGKIPPPARLAMPALERDAIVHAARLTQGRVQEMSRLLNIGRTTLWRKMKQYNIDASQFKGR